MKLSLCYTSRLARHEQSVWAATGPAEYHPPAPDPDLVMALRREEFDHRLAVPRVGRFYPARLIVSADHRRARFFRVTSLPEDRFVADFNPPLAGWPGQVEYRRLPATETARSTSGRLLDWAGMEAALPDAETDFADNNAFEREDDSDDATFYSQPRRVLHVDQACATRITACYRRLLAPRQRVMDLMAGWRSHLPAVRGSTLGVGMNAVEMADNPQLDDYLVHDLNREPGLPIADESFDAVVNTVSIEYLVQPVAVLRSAWEKLKRGGLMIITLSDRFFPPKAIRLWQRLHPVERVAWVADLMRQAGFENIHTLVEQGTDRPPDDRYAAQRQEMDPLMAVWGLPA